MVRRFERDHSSRLAISACAQIAVASSGNANHAGRASAPEASNSESALATFRWADRKLSISRSPYRAQRSRLAAREATTQEITPPTTAPSSAADRWTIDSGDTTEVPGRATPTGHTRAG